ncbi:hypothetical protein EDD86DRAFT_215583 [Gorgonomyces haynaldii]|nr:hypothetical protein EDD86DRAFT_215583 [Gorgonomyces haynaldii]
MKTPQEVVVHALKGSARAYALGFLLKGGITFLIRLVRVLQRKMSLGQALLLVFEKASHRFGLMVGTFALLWKLINNMLELKRKKRSKLNGAIAGAVAGLAVLVETRENRITVAQQFSMRAVQAGYNSLHARELIRIPHGDALMFALACGSIMYAYVVYPHTIPREYYSWMVQIAGCPKECLQLNRENIHRWLKGNKEASLSKWLQVLQKLKAKPEAVEAFTNYVHKHNGTIPMTPCAGLHPTEMSCVKYNLDLLKSVYLAITPVYLSLNSVPLLLFKPKAFLKDPLSSLKRIALSTLQSSTFLATFIVIFMSGVCVLRNARGDLPDNRFYYYLLGVLCSGSAIMLEKPSRRSELAMYVFPKGLASLYTLLIARGRMIDIPYIEVITTCASTSAIMSLYQLEPEHMSSLMYNVMRRVIGEY